MPRGLILFDLGKPANRFAEDIVGLVVIHGRDLADQHIAPLAPKGVPVPGHEGDAFTGRKAQLFSGAKGAVDPVAAHHAAPVRREIAPVVRAKQFYHQRRAAAVDDIFRLDDMGVHGRQLILP